jgi:hypothetical protein
MGETGNQAFPFSVLQDVRRHLCDSLSF